MKAWRVHAFGPPEAMFLEMVPSLFDHARLEAGQTVVIHGAAGVGAHAVQHARRARPHSIATVGTKNIDYVKVADKVVDYHTSLRR
jgi:NADPH:quinone reductase-like Zn-dependent oxidoreductase